MALPLVYFVDVLSVITTSDFIGPGHVIASSKQQRQADRIHILWQ